jgi:hypothetical protein
MSELCYRKVKRHYKYRVDKFEPYYNKALEHIELRTPYIAIRNSLLYIQKDYAWDGATLAIDTKTFMRGSLIHDALYQLIRLGFIPPAFRKTADKILRDVCLKDGMSRIRAWWVYRGVRIGGYWAAKPRPEEDKIICVGDYAKA